MQTFIYQCLECLEDRDKPILVLSIDMQNIECPKCGRIIECVFMADRETVH